MGACIYFIALLERSLQKFQERVQSNYNTLRCEMWIVCFSKFIDVSFSLWNGLHALYWC